MEMTNLTKILEVLKNADIQWLMSVGIEINVNTGETVIKEGSYIENIYIVLEGELGVYLSSSGGKKISTVGVGEIVGEMSYLEDKITTASVVAQENSVLIAIPRELLDVKVEEESAFGKRLYKGLAISLSQRLRSILEHMDYILKMLDKAKDWSDKTNSKA
ncbi:cyclic nucleotide-binding protein [Candidatus Magnetobacterium bavaricum]|uniref:Cyclic nucleotide-binding protein n=1 Tax=Candidatus Magnetobacterium bavaricum TaxID=29290 RepID=A0A0F3GLB3_9BACT|nr:cyclic nucleotide-binding protein [Candidatus Magnetobacterium bavaricum]